MRNVADVILWALVQMPLAFLGEGVSWCDRHLKRSYWSVVRLRRRVMGRPALQPHDTLLTSTHPARSE